MPRFGSLLLAVMVLGTGMVHSQTTAPRVHHYKLVSSLMTDNRVLNELQLTDAQERAIDELGEMVQQKERGYLEKLKD
jgi:hypothetical protein